MGGAGEPLPSGPGLPQEPERPTSLQDAELWAEVYNRYVENVTQAAREEGVEDELQPWIDRCARRRVYWAHARERLQRLEAHKRVEE